MYGVCLIFAITVCNQCCFNCKCIINFAHTSPAGGTHYPRSNKYPPTILQGFTYWNGLFVHIVNCTMYIIQTVYANNVLYV